jgi:hypothetical protein
VTAAHPHEPPGSQGAERRRHPRFLASGRLVGTLVAQDLPVRVRDVSSGGFSVETMEPVPTGATEPVRFTTADDWTAVLEARSLHCRPSVSPNGLPLFVTGFEFAEPDKVRPSIVTLIEKITSVRLSDES